jgi:hypothetical protein
MACLEGSVLCFTAMVVLHHGRASYICTSYGGGFAALWRYRDRSSQEYLTPGCQVLGGYEKLGTLPDMISSPDSYFTVLDHVKII